MKGAPGYWKNDRDTPRPVASLPLGPICVHLRASAAILEVFALQARIKPVEAIHGGQTTRIAFVENRLLARAVHQRVAYLRNRARERAVQYWHAKHIAATGH